MKAAWKVYRCVLSRIIMEKWDSNAKLFSLLKIIWIGIGYEKRKQLNQNSSNENNDIILET